MTLTEVRHWDDIWEGVRLPVEQRHIRGRFYDNAILAVLDRYLPSDARLSAVELGGAPGGYLAYLHRAKGYQITGVDYSEIGCRKTAENWRLLGIDGEVIQADLFTAELPTFDVVYSLGLIEHFAERTEVVGRHVRLLRPGGYLVLGVPNLQGVSGWFLRRLAPELYAAHDIPAMDLDGWREFEDRFALDVLFKGYIGGFEPATFCRREPGSSWVLFGIARALALVLDRRPLGFLRRWNAWWFSGYAMAAYRMRSSVSHRR